MVLSPLSLFPKLRCSDCKLLFFLSDSLLLLQIHAGLGGEEADQSAEKGGGGLHPVLKNQVL